MTQVTPLAGGEISGWLQELPKGSVDSGSEVPPVCAERNNSLCVFQCCAVVKADSPGTSVGAAYASIPS